jgi:RNA polymerase sigma-70 factor (ECF subfamily)
MDLELLVQRARRGDLAAFEKLVQATQAMVYGVAHRIVRNDADARDATQETFLRIFARLKELKDDAAFPGWIRRIAINCATSIRRSRRSSLGDEAMSAHVPVLDEQESSWSSEHRLALGSSLLSLSSEDRSLCERFYFGGSTSAELAADAGVADATIRKRLERIRQRLLREMQMSEQQAVNGKLPAGLPAKIVELLARPRLVILPENPVGATWKIIRAELPEFEEVDVPEVVTDGVVAKLLGEEDPWIHLHGQDQGVHRIDDESFLRSELDLPLVLSLRGRSGPLAVMSAGKVYRATQESRTRLEAFNQAEILLSGEGLREWNFMARLQAMLERLLPGKMWRMEQFTVPLCDRAWAMAAQWDGQWTDVCAWGAYSAKVVKWLGNDPQKFGSLGISFGLERLACMHFGIDDIRKIDAARVSG